MRARDVAGDVGPELAKELLSRGREVVVRARGSSMAPLILDGDRLTLAPLERARAGEVLAAISRGRLLVHRAIRAREGEALLQGDALWDSDGWFSSSVADEQLIGRVKAIHRDEDQLGDWRLGGFRARIWTRALPLVRAFRGLARRLRSLRHSSPALHDG